MKSFLIGLLFFGCSFVFANSKDIVIKYDKELKVNPRVVATQYIEQDLQNDLEKIKDVLSVNLEETKKIFYDSKIIFKANFFKVVWNEGKNDLERFQETRYYLIDNYKLNRIKVQPYFVPKYNFYEILNYKDVLNKITLKNEHIFSDKEECGNFFLRGIEKNKELAIIYHSSRSNETFEEYKKIKKCSVGIPGFILSQDSLKNMP